MLTSIKDFELVNFGFLILHTFHYVLSWFFLDYIQIQKFNSYQLGNCY